MRRYNVPFSVFFVAILAVVFLTSVIIAATHTCGNKYHYFIPESNRTQAVASYVQLVTNIVQSPMDDYHKAEAMKSAKSTIEELYGVPIPDDSNDVQHRGTSVQPPRDSSNQRKDSVQVSGGVGA